MLLLTIEFVYGLTDIVFDSLRLSIFEVVILDRLGRENSTDFRFWGFAFLQAST